MKDYLDVINNASIFEGIDINELSALMDCLKARIIKYKKGEMIFLAGNSALGVGIICDGHVQIIRDDIFGNRSIIEHLNKGNLFGEVFACAKIDFLPVSVMALSDCSILMINFRKIMTTCSTACIFHSTLIENMLKVLAEKNLKLTQKIEILSARTTRDKIMTYLSFRAAETKSNRFNIPFNRQALADFLSVDRSAMSAELSRMQEEGLITFHKNVFELQNQSHG